MKFIKYYELIDVQARMRMRAGVSRMLLSYFWWILEPLLFVCMFYVIFDLILHRGGHGFFTFLFIGQSTFLWFSKAVVMGSRGLLQNKGIIGQTSIPKWVFPLVNVQEATYKSLIMIIMMLVVVVMSKHYYFYAWWQLVPLFIIQYFLIIGISYLFSILVAFAEDFSNIISLLMTFMMFGSGVFWNLNNIGSVHIRNLVKHFNPMALLLDSYRRILLNGEHIHFSEFIVPIVAILILNVISIYALHILSNKITRRLFS